MSIKFYIPALLWATLILIIIAIPGNYIPTPHGIWGSISPDKIIHFGLFAPLSFLLAKGINQKYNIRMQAIVLSGVFGIIYAILTEVLQFYVIPGRNGNIFDALADIIGILIGLALFRKITNSKG